MFKVNYDWKLEETAIYINFVEFHVSLSIQRSFVFEKGIKSIKIYF